MSLSNCAEIWKWLLNTHQRIKPKLNLNGVCYSARKGGSWQSRAEASCRALCGAAPGAAGGITAAGADPTFQAIGSNQFSIHSKRCLASFPSNRLLYMAILRRTWTELIQLVCLYIYIYIYLNTTVHVLSYALSSRITHSHSFKAETPGIKVISYTIYPPGKNN